MRPAVAIAGDMGGSRRISWRLGGLFESGDLGAQVLQLL